jgi:hypothetical protein
MKSFPILDLVAVSRLPSGEWLVTTGAFSVLIPSTALEIRIAPESRTP